MALGLLGACVGGELARGVMNQDLGTVNCVQYTHYIRDYFRLTNPQEQKNCGAESIFNVKLPFFASKNL